MCVGRFSMLTLEADRVTVQPRRDQTQAPSVHYARMARQNARDFGRKRRTSIKGESPSISVTSDYHIYHISIGNARDEKGAGRPQIQCSKEAPATLDEHWEEPFFVPGNRQEKQVVPKTTNSPVRQAFRHPPVYPAQLQISQQLS